MELLKVLFILTVPERNSISILTCKIQCLLAVPVYLLQHKIHINSCVLLKHNSVISGGGIFSSRSVIAFTKKSNVIFYNNLANTEAEQFFLMTPDYTLEQLLL